MLFRYENLEVSERTAELIDLVYEITDQFPDSERFGLVTQLRRAVVSVYLNLAEGSARKSKKEFGRFLTISLGSLVETHAGCKIALRRRFVGEKDLEPIKAKIEQVWFKLCALRKSQTE